MLEKRILKSSMKKNIFIICLITIFTVSSFCILTQEDQFKKAKAEKDGTAMTILFEGIYQEDHDSIFGQKSLLELAKYNFFKRDYKNVVSLLKKIHQIHNLQTLD